METSPYIERKATPIIRTALTDTRVVLISGPHQAGKTTLARQFADKGRPYITLDDAGTLNAAKADPTEFIRGIDRAVIDEIQRAPDLMLAIKESVDRDQTPGRFLLTGSANLATVPAIADSLQAAWPLHHCYPSPSPKSARRQDDSLIACLMEKSQPQGKGPYLVTS